MHGLKRCPYPIAGDLTADILQSRSQSIRSFSFEMKGCRMHLEKSKYSYFKWRLPPKTKSISGGRLSLPWHLFKGRDAVVENCRFHFTRGIDIHFRGELFMFVDDTHTQAKHTFAS